MFQNSSIIFVSFIFQRFSPVDIYNTISCICGSLLYLFGFVVIGILLMNEEVLLEMEFFRLAQYLTRLSNTITSDELFKYIEKINFSKQKMQSTLAHFKLLARQNPRPPT